MDRDKTMRETVEETRLAAKTRLGESEKYNESEHREYRMKEKRLSGLRGMYRHRKHRQLRHVFQQMKHGHIRITRFKGVYQATYAERGPWMGALDGEGDDATT